MAKRPAHMIDWYRVPIPRDELRNLTRRSDGLALLQSAGFLLILVVTGTMSWIAWNAAAAGSFPVWAVVFIVYFHGMMWAFLLQGFHELVHYSVFKTRWIGTLFLNIYSFLGWFDPVFFRASHNRHHLYTLHPPQDREVVLPIRFRLTGYLKEAIIDPLGIYHRTRAFIRTAIGKYNGDWQREIFTEDGEKAQRHLRNWSRYFLLGHAALVAVAVATQTWQLIVLITLAPFYGRWLEWLCNQTQHVGLSDNVSDFRLCCRTFTLNPILRFVYWHMNYHTEHHMYAAVPCYRLHKLNKMIAPSMPTCTNGLVATWREIITTMKRQDKDPDYRYTPALPDSPRDR